MKADKNNAQNALETADKRQELDTQKQGLAEKEIPKKADKAAPGSTVKPLDTAKKPKKPPKAPRKKKAGKKIGRPTKEEAAAKEAAAKEAEEKERAEAEQENPILSQLEDMTSLGAELLSELCKQYLPPELSSEEKAILAKAAVPLAREKVPELSSSQIFIGTLAIVMLPRGIMKFKALEEKRQARRAAQAKQVPAIVKGREPEHAPPQVQPEAEPEAGGYAPGDLEL